jgi:hypothetical protein
MSGREGLAFATAKGRGRFFLILTYRDTLNKINFKCKCSDREEGLGRLREYLTQNHPKINQNNIR